MPKFGEIVGMLHWEFHEMVPRLGKKRNNLQFIEGVVRHQISSTLVPVSPRNARTARVALRR